MKIDYISVMITIVIILVFLLSLILYRNYILFQTKNRVKLRLEYEIDNSKKNIEKKTEYRNKQLEAIIEQNGIYFLEILDILENNKNCNEEKEEVEY